MAGDGLGQGAQVRSAEERWALRSVLCGNVKRHGQSVFRKPEARGGFERGEGNSGHEDRSRWPHAPRKRRGWARLVTKEARQRSPTKANSGGKVSEHSTKHSTRPHHTPSVRVYAPAKQKSNGETARPSGPVTVRCAGAVFLLDASRIRFGSVPNMQWQSGGRPVLPVSCRDQGRRGFHDFRCIRRRRGTVEHGWRVTTGREGRGYMTAEACPGGPAEPLRLLAFRRYFRRRGVPKCVRRRQPGSPDQRVSGPTLGGLRA